MGLSKIILIVAQWGKGDSWQVEHLTQVDEFELEVDAVCVYVFTCAVCGRTKKSVMDDSSGAFVLTAKISQPWKHTSAHSHRQALQIAKSSQVTSLVAGLGFLG